MAIFFENSAIRVDAIVRISVTAEVNMSISVDVSSLLYLHPPNNPGSM